MVSTRTKTVYGNRKDGERMWKMEDDGDEM